MKHSYFIFDLARGISAALVLLGHLRAFMFVNYSNLEEKTLITKVFYALSGLGHQSVMVFFVLSGFLISKTLIEPYDKTGNVDYGKYSINRITRLWMVLIPCLFLTVLWDSLGNNYGNSEFYDGLQNAAYNSGPLIGEYSASAGSFFMNVLFLQTIIAPCFGSNSPLWSLANEFWYYVLFPLMFYMIAGRTFAIKVLCISIIAGLFFFLPRELLLLGLIWLVGVGGYFVSRSRLINLFRGRYVKLTTILLLVISLMLTRSKIITGFVSDIIIAVTFVVVLLSLLDFQVKDGWIKKCITVLADQSYTLYVSHFPFVAFLVGFVFQGKLMQFGVWQLMIYTLIATTALFYSYVIYYIFEKNTNLVKKNVVTTLGRHCR